MHATHVGKGFLKGLFFFCKSELSDQKGTVDFIRVLNIVIPWSCL